MSSTHPYSEIVMDHFANPRNMGDMVKPSAIGNVGNPACGDMMRLYLKIEDGKIVDAKFKTFGCGAAIARLSRTGRLGGIRRARPHGGSDGGRGGGHRTWRGPRWRRLSGISPR